MEKKIFIYVGLPKAGSGFLRQEVFPRFDNKKFCLNPPDIFNLLSKALAEKETTILDGGGFRKKIEEEINKLDKENIVLTGVSFAGDAYDNFKDFEKNTNIISDLFPKAEIIFVLRNQVDWILSLYKHVAKASILSVDRFLNYTDGTFAGRTQAGYDNINALGFDYVPMCARYMEKFGEENVHILFQENLRNNPQAFMSDLQKLLGGNVEGDINFRTENRGFSSFALYVTWIRIWLRQLFFFLFGFHGKRPSRSGVFARVMNFLAQRALPGECWRSAVRKKGLIYAPVIILHRLLKQFRWKQFVQGTLDTALYVNWDMMGRKKRKILFQHYSDRNRELLQYIKDSEVAKYYTAQEGKTSS